MPLGGYRGATLTTLIIGIIFVPLKCCSMISYNSAVIRQYRVVQSSLYSGVQQEDNSIKRGTKWWSWQHRLASNGEQILQFITEY